MRNAVNAGRNVGITMKVVRVGDGLPYDAPKHFKYWSMNKIFGDDAQRLTIGVSHFLPGGGAEMSSSLMERVYYVVRGSILVKGKDEEHLLGPDDMIYFGPGEERGFEVQGTTPATIIVIIVKVD